MFWLFCLLVILGLWVKKMEAILTGISSIRDGEKCLKCWFLFQFVCVRDSVDYKFLLIVHKAYKSVTSIFLNYDRVLGWCTVIPSIIASVLCTMLLWSRGGVHFSNACIGLTLLYLLWIAELISWTYVFEGLLISDASWNIDTMWSTVTYPLETESTKYGKWPISAAIQLLVIAASTTIWRWWWGRWPCSPSKAHKQL